MTLALMDRVRGVARVQADVEALLGYLREGAQDRAVLAMRLHVTDRRMRRSIDHARRRGELVIFDREDKLYRLARSRAEYEAWEQHEVDSRLGAFFAQRKAMREAVARKWPEQLRLLA